MGFIMKFVAIAFAGCLAGCATQASTSYIDPPQAPGTPYPLTPAQIEKTKSVVGGTLKDPFSAQFKDIRAVSKAGSINICGEVNSKNSYGGYVGFTPFLALLNAQTGTITPGAVVETDDSGFTTKFVADKCA